jgi:phosphoglycerate dehydrogenase-like enzyme
MIVRQRTLIIHDGNNEYIDDLRKQFSDHQFDLCSESETVTEAVLRVNPTIALAFRSGRFPGPSHAPILSAPSIKWFQSGGSGIDHLPYWDFEKIAVTNAAGVSGKYMAETVTGAILMMNYGFPKLLQNQKNKIWDPKDWQSLDQKVALIIGLGGIGSRVAERLKSFGMRVIGVRNSTKSCKYVDELIPMSEIKFSLSQADYVCIHVPNTPSTYNIVNKEFLSAMKPSARLINTARGSQVDENSLIEALNTGEIAEAFLDVFDFEPLPQNSPLWDTPNLIISPHVSDQITGWEKNSALFFAENFERYISGIQLVNVCDPILGY